MSGLIGNIYKKQIYIISELKDIYCETSDDGIKEKLTYIVGSSLQCINGIIENKSDIIKNNKIDNDFLINIYQYAKNKCNNILTNTIGRYISHMRN